MTTLYRMHLKTDVKTLELRQRLIETCLDQQFLAIGWSYLYEKYTIQSIDDLCEKEKKETGKLPSALKIFKNIEVNDLIWTRDLNGNGYLCRVKDKAKTVSVPQLDIGCILPVEIYLIGTNLPGRVISSFIPSKAIQRVCDDKILYYSQLLYNMKSGSNTYSRKKMELDLFGILHPLDVEELVCCYVQIKYNVFLSKNSVAKQDTTIKIEGEFFPRCKDQCSFDSIVLQVKTGSSYVPVSEYHSFVAQNKVVVLFFECEIYDEDAKGIECLTKKELLNFAYENEDILPPVLRNAIKMCRTKSGPVL